MNVVLDTCGLLYWTLAPDRLAAPTARLLDDAAAPDTVALCSVSVWEIALKHEAGRLDLGIRLDDYLRRIRRLPMTLVAVDDWLWVESVRLDWAHRDPADRLIVALARRRGATIISTDRRIADFHPDTRR